jgi:hypothetical protein
VAAWKDKHLCREVHYDSSRRPKCPAAGLQLVELRLALNVDHTHDVFGSSEKKGGGAEALAEQLIRPEVRVI